MRRTVIQPAIVLMNLSVLPILMSEEDCTMHPAKNLQYEGGTA
jgi:hypothetical protein